MRFVLIILMLMTISCAHQWSRQDTYRQAAFTTLALIDWGQTRYIFDSKYEEHNPLITEDNVDIYFPVAIVLHTALSMMLPPKERLWWQNITIITEGACISHNAMIGIGVKY